MIISLTTPTSTKAQGKEIRYFQYGNARTEHSPFWEITIPSHSNSNNYWTLTYSSQGVLSCNCPSTIPFCKHTQKFKVKLGEAFLSMCLESNQIPLDTLSTVINKAFSDYYLVLEDPVSL